MHCIGPCVMKYVVNRENYALLLAMIVDIIPKGG